MTLADLFRLSVLLSRLSRGPSAAAAPGVEELPDQPLSGDRPGRFDLYLPAGGTARAAVVAVHGITAQGRKEPRLVHFARCLARSGVACAVPTLPAMSACLTDPADLDVLEQVTLATAARADRRPGLVGFSYGAAFSLVVAARPAMADVLRFVIAIGAYHDLGDLHSIYAAAADRGAPTGEQLDDHIYMHLVVALGMLDGLSLPPGGAQRLRRLYADYCHGGATLDEKRAAYRELLWPRDLPYRNLRRHDAATLDALSPAGKLAAVTCPVRLIHDSRDELVPPRHAEAILAELRRGEAGDHHSLLITSLLSHVELSGLVRLDQVARLFAALAPIIEAS